MTPTVPRACVIGWPVKHSRSPLIHGYWLRELGIAGQYERAEIEPSGFADFVQNFGRNGFRGGNVTLPHKAAAYALATRRTERAERLQAVNTMWIEGGELWGDNTDIIGFLAALDDEALGWDKSGQKAIVLGAGGAARAIVCALILRNISQIIILNRSLGRAQELAKMSGPHVQAWPWTACGEALQGADILVNTTSLGMAGQPNLEVDLSPLPDHAVVNDIVYVPLETPLLAQARARGLRTVGGLSMLLHQAAPGFEHWFEQLPVVTPELRAFIEADVRRSA